MSDTETKPASLLSDIFRSFISLPKWVKFWLMFILGPVNFASLFFLDEPEGMLTAGLVFAGVILSTAPAFYERGISKASAFGHLLPWTILVVHILIARPEGGSYAYNTYLTVLAIVNGISLAFDYVDSYSWIKGNRAVVRPTN